MAAYLDSRIMSPRRQRMLGSCDKTAGCRPRRLPTCFDLPDIPLFSTQMSRNGQDAFFASPSHVSKTDCCLNLRGKDRADDFEESTTKGFLFQGDAVSDKPSSRGNTFDMLDVTKCQWAVGHRYHRENLCHTVSYELIRTRNLTG